MIGWISLQTTFHISRTCKQSFDTNKNYASSCFLFAILPTATSSRGHCERQDVWRFFWSHSFVPHTLSPASFIWYFGSENFYKSNAWVPASWHQGYQTCMSVQCWLSTLVCQFVWPPNVIAEVGYEADGNIWLFNGITFLSIKYFVCKININSILKYLFTTTLWIINYSVIIIIILIYAGRAKAIRPSLPQNQLNYHNYTI